MSLKEECPYCRDEAGGAPVFLICFEKSGSLAYVFRSCDGYVRELASRFQKGGVSTHVMGLEEYSRWKAAVDVMGS